MANKTPLPLQGVKPSNFSGEISGPLTGTVMMDLSLSVLEEVTVVCLEEQSEHLATGARRNVQVRFQVLTATIAVTTKTVSFSETSVSIYQTTWHSITGSRHLRFVSSSYVTRCHCPN
jgi:hypothetical protein